MNIAESEWHTPSIPPLGEEQGCSTELDWQSRERLSVRGVTLELALIVGGNMIIRCLVVVVGVMVLAGCMPSAKKRQTAYAKARQAEESRLAARDVVPQLGIAFESERLNHFSRIRNRNG